MRQLTESELALVGGAATEAPGQWLLSCGSVTAGLFSAAGYAAKRNYSGAFVQLTMASTGIYSCVVGAGNYIMESTKAISTTNCVDMGNGYSLCTYQDAGFGVSMALPNFAPIAGAVEAIPSSYESSDLSAAVNTTINSINTTAWDGTVSFMQYNTTWAADYSAYNPSFF